MGSRSFKRKNHIKNIIDNLLLWQVTSGLCVPCLDKITKKILKERKIKNENN